MASRRKAGTAIIINNVQFLRELGIQTRDGADIDVDNFSRGFQRLGIDERDIHIHTDMTASGMKQCLEESMTNDDHIHSGSFMCAILTHGGQGEFATTGTRAVGDLVWGTDGSIPLRELVEIPCGCQALHGKPKIFIVLACRGNEYSIPFQVECATHAQAQPPAAMLDDTTADEIDHPGGKGARAMAADDVTDIGSFPPRPQNEPDDRPLTKKERLELEDMEIPVPADMPVPNDCLVVYATQPGFAAFRNKETGSPFSWHFLKQVEQHGTSMNFMKLLTRVSHDVAYCFTSNSPDGAEMHGKKMMPWIASRISKDITFGPKLESV